MLLFLLFPIKPEIEITDFQMSGKYVQYYQIFTGHFKNLLEIL